MTTYKQSFILMVGLKKNEYFHFYHSKKKAANYAEIDWVHVGKLETGF